MTLHITCCESPDVSHGRYAVYGFISGAFSVIALEAVLHSLGFL